MFDIPLLWSHLVLDFCLLGVFNHILISVLVIGLYISSVSSWVSCGKLYCSENLSISSRLFILLSYSCSHDDLYFCGVSCNFSFFISSFIDMSLLSVFVDESGYWFICFVCLSFQRTRF